MNNIRTLLIGLVIGGGAGAKIGAYLSSLLETPTSWSLIEWGAGFGMVLGLTVSSIIVLAKAGAFSVREKEIDKSSHQMATS